MTSACNRISFPPGKFFIFHRKHSSPAKYRALPPEHKTFTFAVFGGTGMRTLISCATVFSANTDLNMTSTETRVRPNSFTMAMTLNGIETFSDTRYFMSSNSPSGGTNETTLSLANFERFTQWWNCKSSKSIVFRLFAKEGIPRKSISLPPPPASTAFGLFLPPFASSPKLSFNPIFNSGMPLNFAFNTTLPLHEALNASPFACVTHEIVSITSK